MKPAKILITGAAGFIGSRLCERLKLHYQLPYRALVRSFTKANRIARLDSEMVGGDLLDPVAVRRALHGCDAVVHLAHSEDSTAPQETKNLLQACRAEKIRRFVHISSMAVHGPRPGSECAHEATATIRRYGEAYSDSKATVENLVRHAIKNGRMDGVILRPTIVYGPYSPHVFQVIEPARRGEISLIDGGASVCNAVYVDDVCDAIHRALLTDRGLGQAFFITADQAVTWQEFILTFANMVGPMPTVREFDSAELLKHWAAQRPTLKSNLRALVRLAASPEFHRQLSSVPAIGTVIFTAKRTLRGWLSDDYALRLKQLSPTTVAMPAALLSRRPTVNRVLRETFPVRFSNSLASEVLDWRPAYDLPRGAAVTRTWLSFARLLTADISR